MSKNKNRLLAASAFFCALTITHVSANTSVVFSDNNSEELALRALPTIPIPQKIHDRVLEQIEIKKEKIRLAEETAKKQQDQEKKKQEAQRLAMIEERKQERLAREEQAAREAKKIAKLMLQDHVIPGLTHKPISAVLLLDLSGLPPLLLVL